MPKHFVESGKGSGKLQVVARCSASKRHNWSRRREIRQMHLAVRTRAHSNVWEPCVHSTALRLLSHPKKNAPSLRPFVQLLLLQGCSDHSLGSRRYLGPIRAYLPPLNEPIGRDSNNEGGGGEEGRKENFGQEK